MQRLLHFTLLTVFVTLTRGEATCSIEKHLNDCGFTGIQQAQCEEQGCCWNPEAPEGSPWCFHKNAGYKYFNPDLPRVDCGYFGIDAASCRKHGCHYSPSFMAAWCCYPNTNVDPSTCPKERIDCGYVGITQDDCESFDCCYIPLKYESKDPWCFYAKPKEIAIKPATKAASLSPSPVEGKPTIVAETSIKETVTSLPTVAVTTVQEITIAAEHPPEKPILVERPAEVIVVTMPLPTATSSQEAPEALESPDSDAIFEDETGETELESVESENS